jgi:uncharacterized protein HemY
MDQYLIYFLPFIVVGLGIMLAPFVSDQWPDWLINFVEFCAEMSNGVWVAGVVLVILISMSVPVPAAALLSLPVMYFAGRYFARMSERMDERTREIKRQGWEAHRKKEEDARKRDH